MYFANLILDSNNLTISVKEYNTNHVVLFILLFLPNPCFAYRPTGISSFGLAKSHNFSRQLLKNTGELFIGTNTG
jgi:hypothetical protein